MELWQSTVGDTVSAGGSGDGSVHGRGGVEGSEEAERARDEENAHVVGPHMVRNGQRHRFGDLCINGIRGQESRGARCGSVLRYLWNLCHALCLLLH